MSDSSVRGYTDLQLLESLYGATCKEVNRIGDSGERPPGNMLKKEAENASAYCLSQK
jgi:hypothetical protein